MNESLTCPICGKDLILNEFPRLSKTGESMYQYRCPDDSYGNENMTHIFASIFCETQEEAAKIVSMRNGKKRKPVFEVLFLLVFVAIVTAAIVFGRI